MKFIRFVKKYRINSVFVRNFIISFLIILIPMLIINLLVFGFYNNRNEEHAKRELNSLCDNIDNTFEWIYSNRDYMTNDMYVTLFLHDAYDNENTFTMTNIIKGNIDKVRLGSSCIDEVYLYSYKNGYVMSSVGSGYIDTFKKHRIDENIDKNSDTYINVYDNISGRKVIRTQMPIKSYDICIGNLMVDIDYNILKNNLLKLISENSGVSVMYKDSIIFEVGDIDHSKKVLLKKSDITGIEYQYSFTRIAFIFPIFVIVLLSTFLFAVLSACFLTYKASMPIGDIIDIMENVTSSDSEIENDRLVGEARYILRTYLDKVHYSKEIEDNLKQRMADLKAIQLQSLNLQIRPHFIFNTLQIISILAMNLTGGENDAVKAIEMLSKILQYGFKSNSYLETLDKELEFSRAYTEIQKIRYNDRVNIRYEIDDQVRNNVTSKMILQPLIENSFSHGIIPHKASGEIIIKAYSKNLYLVIEVIDDGVGIGENIKEKITAQLLSDAQIENGHIGIFNVDRKIKLIFGEQYGLTIDDDYKNGTKIIIKQPLL